MQHFVFNSLYTFIPRSPDSHFACGVTDSKGQGKPGRGNNLFPGLLFKAVNFCSAFEFFISVEVLSDLVLFCYLKTENRFRLPFKKYKSVKYIEIIL